MGDQEAVARLFTPSFARLCENHGVDLAVLFGSRASEHVSPDSDIDLAVLLAEKDVGGSDSEKLHTATGLLKDLMHFLETADIDLVILNRADSLLRFEVARTGRPLYESAAGSFADFCSLALRQHEDSAVFYRATDRYLERAARKAKEHG